MRTRLKAGSSPGADGDEQRVVLEPAAVGEDGAPRLHVHLRQLAADELGAGRARHVGEVVPLHVAAGERHADGHGPVGELPLRGEQRQRDPVAGKVAQCEQRLQAGDAAAGDEHPMRRAAVRGQGVLLAVVERLLG